MIRTQFARSGGWRVGITFSPWSITILWLLWISQVMWGTICMWRFYLENLRKVGRENLLPSNQGMLVSLCVTVVPGDLRGRFCDKKHHAKLQRRNVFLLCWGCWWIGSVVYVSINGISPAVNPEGPGERGFVGKSWDKLGLEGGRGDVLFLVSEATVQ